MYARKIRQAIISSHFSQARFSTSLESLFNKIVNEYRLEQTKYDRETKHSTDPVQQKRWNKIIDVQLASLSAYSNPTVRISLL